MKKRRLDPHHLDVSAFAENAAELSGDIPLLDCQKLLDYAAPDAPPGHKNIVTWMARGELRPVRSQAPEVWLHLDASASLFMACQRCLQPLLVTLQVQRSLRFVAGEDAAAAEDAESDDDVLALTQSLNLFELIEDELVLSLPWVPRHEVCPSPLPQATPESEMKEPHPFAVLAQLKKPKDF
jgi:uncharacterized protein